MRKIWLSITILTVLLSFCGCGDQAKSKLYHDPYSALNGENEKEIFDFKYVSGKIADEWGQTSGIPNGIWTVGDPPEQITRFKAQLPTVLGTPSVNTCNFDVRNLRTGHLYVFQKG